MKLFSLRSSAAADSVRITLNFKGLDYENVLIESSNAHNNKLPERLSDFKPPLSPVLMDEQRMFVETLSIIEYLDETYPDPPLLPGNARDRAQIRTLAEVIAANLHPMINLRMQLYLEDVEIDQKEWHQKWIDDGFNLLENLLEANTARGLYSHGDDPTLADVCLVPEVWAAQRLGLELQRYPVTESIYNACMELEEFKNVALGLD